MRIVAAKLQRTLWKTVNGKKIRDKDAETIRTLREHCEKLTKRIAELESRELERKDKAVADAVAGEL